MRVCVIGNFDSEDPGHATIAPALRLAAGPEASIDVAWIAPESIAEDGVLDHLKDADAVVGAPGPTASPDGAIDAIEFAREGELPYLGIELGMDLAVVEFARTVMTLANAHSTEFDPAMRDAVIVELEPPEVVKGRPSDIFGEQLVRYAKDCRLGAWAGAPTTREQHRSRYGVSAVYKNQIVRAGMKIAATDDTQLVVRALELASHPFFVLTSFAPQLRAPEQGPHPVFREFLNAIEE